MSLVLLLQNPNLILLFNYVEPFKRHFLLSKHTSVILTSKIIHDTFLRVYTETFNFKHGKTTHIYADNDLGYITLFADAIFIKIS